MLVDENKKTKDLSLPSFVRPPEVVQLSIVIGVPRGWLKTSYSINFEMLFSIKLKRSLNTAADSIFAKLFV